jgi:hypothetical protein
VRGGLCGVWEGERKRERRGEEGVGGWAWVLAVIGMCLGTDGKRAEGHDSYSAGGTHTNINTHASHMPSVTTWICFASSSSGFSAG